MGPLITGSGLLAQQLQATVEDAALTYSTELHCLLADPQTGPSRAQHHLHDLSPDNWVTSRDLRQSLLLRHGHSENETVHIEAEFSSNLH